MKHSIIFFFSFLLSVQLFAQLQAIEKIEPPNWWSGMENNSLQLMLYGDELAQYHSASVNSDQISIKGLKQVQSSNYIFIDLQLETDIIPGQYIFTIFSDTSIMTFNYDIQERKKGSAERKGFNSSDVIYLIMPDRFANGDEKNDSVESVVEKRDRSKQYGRHGGDIQGIIDHLDYLEDLGVTTLWNTPLMLDNEVRHSYHTYAISDYYQIDPRYGSNEDYRRLAEECHNRDMKLIMDVVTNHCGAAHWWMGDLPTEDWVNQFPTFTRSNHRKQTLNDPYGAESDRYLYDHGWFDTTMPDMNQKNKLLLTYFIQNAIWWIEYADLDGLRVDTYPYNDKWAIAEWAKAVRAEYTDINIVGECWQHKPSELAYWQSGVDNYDGYDSQLPCGMDFCLTDALEVAFNEDEQGWDDGVARFYNSLATDYLYADPYNLMIFCDNHDITRYSGLVQNDIDKYKLAFSFLLTTRGIPQIYYGSELMMEGYKSKGDGDIRRDFPGGWKEDTRSAFTKEGRTAKENEVFDHFKILLNWRKNNPAIHDGKLIHFVPNDNVYVYFRINETKTVMVILNNSNKNRVLDTSRFSNYIPDNGRWNSVLDDEQYNTIEQLTINPKSALILELLSNEG